MTASQAEYSDVLIIGAGISGIGAAYRIHEKNPELSYTVLERRERIGGTWDLFRYPGIRSDSDIFTLSFPYEPWTRPENVADGADIREYLTQTARKHGIDEHIRFNTRVIVGRLGFDHRHVDGADRAGRRAEDLPRPVPVLRHGLLQLRRALHSRSFPGIEEFAGDVVHPQYWPESLDYTGKRVVVIGSGATAVSLIPSLTEKAAHVTMLQRSPTLHAVDAADPPDRAGRSEKCCRCEPPIRSSAWCNVAFIVLTLCGCRRKAPWFSKWLHPAAMPNATCPRAIRSTSTSSRGTTRGTSGCA